MGLFDKIFGGSKQSQESVSGFAALPAEVQDAYLKVYLPKVLSEFNKPQRPLPMKRVEAPNDPFDSQALYELQQYSDKMGGLFTPTNQKVEDNPFARGNTYGPPLAGQQPNAAASGGAAPSALNSLISQFQGMVMDNPGWNLQQNAPGVGQVRKSFLDDPMAFLSQNKITGGDSTASRALRALLGFS